MKKFVLAATVAVIGAVSLPAMAQNIAIVNGKPVPKARADILINQMTKTGQARSPEMEAKVKDEVVIREIFLQEAEKRGLNKTEDYKNQMELARQSVLIRELFSDYQKKNPVTDADAKAEYDKFKAQATGTEYHARHILVEKEDDAKALIKQLNGGAKFEDLATKNSKDTGSAQNGGDLGWSAPDAYVPEFSAAMAKLKAGEMTQEPVKSQFGFHIIKLEETRQAQFPAFEDVKGQIVQRMQQQKVMQFQEELRAKAKTDHKFSTN